MLLNQSTEAEREHSFPWLLEILDVKPKLPYVLFSKLAMEVWVSGHRGTGIDIDAKEFLLMSWYLSSTIVAGQSRGSAVI